jgi:hypothetical protein
MIVDAIDMVYVWYGKKANENEKRHGVYTAQVR